MPDRATIFRSAHAAARKRMSPSETHRYGDRWNAEAGGYVPTFGYREAFRTALMFAWHDAKSIAVGEMIEAEQVSLPIGVQAQVDAMRADAWFEPINAAGNARMSAIFAQAASIAEAARIAMGGLPC